jgi:hypothetical protein
MLDLSISDSDYEDYPESHASTFALTMLDDTTLDELYVNLDSHPELTRDSMDQVHWGNTIKISRYIQDLQQPGGEKDGRIWTPFGEEIQPTREDSPLDVVVEILQCIIKILCIVVIHFKPARQTQWPTTNLMTSGQDQARRNQSRITSQTTVCPAPDNLQSPTRTSTGRRSRQQQTSPGWPLQHHPG